MSFVFFAVLTLRTSAPSPETFFEPRQHQAERRCFGAVLWLWLGILDNTYPLALERACAEPDRSCWRLDRRDELQSEIPSLTLQRLQLALSFLLFEFLAAPLYPVQPTGNHPVENTRQNSGHGFDCSTSA